MVMDYGSKFKKITIQNIYALSLILTLLECFNGPKVFAKLDLGGTYNHVQIHLDDE